MKPVSKISKKSLIIIILTSIIIAASAVCFIFFASKPVSQDVAPITDAIPGSEPPYHFDYSWTASHPYVAHAFGGILGDSYTNSYEAFLLNYQLGHRIFEVDFSITTDGHTVAAHDAAHWQNHSTVYQNGDFIETSPNISDFTYNNFMSSLWYGKYHPIDLNLLFKIMQQYPDIYIITDTKFSDQTNVEKQFTAFVEAADQIDPSLLDRFIIQIYKPDMLSQIMSIHPWKSVIYTLYSNPEWTPENVLTFANQSGVKLITMWGSLITTDIVKLWQPAGIQIAAHTLNQLTYVDQIRSLGVHLFYTDFLLP